MKKQQFKKEIEKEMAEKFFNELRKCDAAQNRKIEKISKQVQEMYKVFTSANWMIKFILKLFGAIGVVAGTVIAIRELFLKTK